MLKITVGGSGRPCGPAQRATAQKITMNGREVFKFAVRAICESVEKVVELADLKIDDINHLIPHQANYRITENAAQRLGLRDKAVSNIADYGNTGAASMPLALAELRQNGRLRRGDIVALVAFGAGLTWGANIIKWSARRRGQNGD